MSLTGLGVLALILLSSGGGKEDAMAEAQIRQRVENWARALRAKDIDGVMSFYAPGIVSFDLNPLLRATRFATSTSLRAATWPSPTASTT